MMSNPPVPDCLIDLQSYSMFAEYQQIFILGISFPCVWKIRFDVCQAFGTFWVK
jgi:hypothetical protein